MDFNRKDLMALPHFNEDTMGKLRERTASNPEIFQEIFESYIEDTNELLEDIKNSLNNNDLDGYYAAIHTYKGLAATIGCTRIFNLLKIMDSLNKEKNFSDSGQLVGELSDMHAELSVLIKEQIL